MIIVRRSANTAKLPLYSEATVKSLDGKSKVTPYERERQAAIAFFTDPANYLNNEKLAEKSFGFRVYKDKQLAAALSQDFRKKCAYCESRFAAVTPSDIEHYRPKASIGAGANELKPGYYWLAGDWDNLLISCPNCNRPRNYKVPGQSEEILLGKGSQFPLSNESKRVRSHEGKIADERKARLLLHPCMDDPDEYLLFEETGLIRAVGVEKERGEASIHAYALQRKDLVEARKDEINELRSKVDDLQRLVRQHNRLSVLGNEAAEARSDNLDHIEKILRAIKAMMSPSTQYVAAKRHWLRAAHEQGEFETIRKFGIKLDLLLNLAA